MKFWELTSAFRDEKDILKSILRDPKWQTFRDSHENLENIAKNQNREILDQEIPHQLAFEVCSQSNKRFFYYPSRLPKLLSTFQWQRNSPNEEMEILSAVDILKRFGGSKIEEVFEKNYTEVY